MEPEFEVQANSLYNMQERQRIVMSSPPLMQLY